MIKNKLFFLLLTGFFLVSCSNTPNKKGSNPVDFDDSYPLGGKLENAEKQVPVFTPSVYPYPFSAAVQLGNILFLSGEIGANEEGTGLVAGGIGPETHRVFERIQATLSQHNLGLDNVFKCTVMLADMSEWPVFNTIYSDYFEEGRYPSRSAMGVNGLALGARVEMECWAYIPRPD